ncbi:hypothetical protein ABIA31_007544 [Catenulispora sp. MAP5-51]|uniref:hypothetical protein n=1 Tax=Catenulispora sp. MAP5-51 TaxID=3156298 RepID=UPI0035197B65
MQVTGLARVRRGGGRPSQQAAALSVVFQIEDDAVLWPVELQRRPYRLAEHDGLDGLRSDLVGEQFRSRLSSDIVRIGPTDLGVLPGFRVHRVSFGGIRHPV